MTGEQRNLGSNPPPAGVDMPKVRLRHPELQDSERNFAIAMHLSVLAGTILWPLMFMPLVLWLIQKDKSAFVDDHGREVLNMLISCFIILPCLLVIGVLTVFLGWVAAIAWGIVIFINMIRGAVAGSNGEFFRYPMIFRFL